MAAITLEHVGKVYPNGVHALNDLSLHVAAGELLVVVGPSGSGKTTLLRLLAGLEGLTSGTIRIGCRDTANVPPGEREVALVFQRPALYPHRTVADNLAFGLQLRRSAETWRRFFWRILRPARFAKTLRQEQLETARVAAAAQLLGLDQVLHRRPFELSGGQQQRVALGRAIVRQPSVFLLDEPLSNLDLPLREEMRRELHLLHGRLQATMIYVTHDQAEAFALGDRVAVLKDGFLQQVDRPLAIYREPCNRFVAGFLGWPPMNFWDGQLVRTAGRVIFAASAGTLLLPEDQAPGLAAFLGRPVTLGIRPEDVCWSATPSPTDGCLAMEVALVEALGGSWLVTFQRDALRITTQRMEQPMLHSGQNVMVALDGRKVHLFDRTTGLNLRVAVRTG